MKYCLLFLIVYSVITSCHLYRTDDGRITNVRESGLTYLKNPSFEGYNYFGPTPVEPPAICNVADIKEWSACSELGKRLGFYKLPEHFYSYSITPQHGRHYLGMEVASDSTWDCIMQKLSEPLLADKKYKMAFWLASFENYPHMIDAKGIVTENKPAILQIWGINMQENFSEIIYATNEVTNTKWERKEIEFSPTGDYEYILIKPSFAQGKGLYNGNILLDNFSAIEIVAD